MEVMGLEVLSLIHAQVFHLAGGAGHTWLIQSVSVGLLCVLQNGFAWIVAISKSLFGCFL